MLFQIGERVGDYEIVAVLGAGGMGKVYKVRNVISDRFEAMKVLLPDLVGDADLADRFLREIKVQASLTHPNIAALHTALRHNNQLLMLMEFVEGESVEAMLDRGPLPVALAVQYTTQVLGALGYAHSKGIIHRDLKPPNMMVTPSGLVKLMDFGIARMRSEKRLTQTGHTLGSLYYMSPEQIRGEQELDARSDIYSLGISLYEIVTGKKPFNKTSDFALMAAHLQENPVPPIQLDPSVPESLSSIIMAAVSKDPAQRFQSAEAFRNALQNVVPAVQTAKLPSTPRHAPAPAVASPPSAAKSYRGLYMALGSLVTLGVILIGAIQIPKYLAARAAQDPQKPAAQQPSTSYTPAVPLSQTPQPSATPGVSPRIDPEAPTPQPAPQPVAQPTPQPAASTAKPTPAPVVAKPAPTPAPVPVQALIPTPVTQPAPTPLPATPRPTPVPAPVAAPQAAPAPQTQTAVTPAELESIRDRMMKLAARVGAVQAKAKRIESEQRTQGLGMRSDVVSGLSRMVFFMDEVERGLGSSNAAAARAALQRADRETENLERILGII